MRSIILGSGPLGMAVMEAEAAKGHDVILVNRSGLVREQIPAGVRVLAGDLRNAQELSESLPDADLIFRCAGAPLQSSEAELSLTIDAACHIASQKSAILIHPDHLFAYGDAGGIPISESSPELANTGILGQWCKTSTRKLLDLHFSGKLKVMIARTPLAYGPRVLEGPLGKGVFTRLLQHKNAQMLGDLDLPHSFAYIKDLGRNLSLLAEHPEAAGKIWHLPSSPALTQQQILDILRDMLSRNVYADLIQRPRGLQNLFSTAHKPWEYILYQFEKPFVCNHTRFATTFGERCTAHPQALWETLEWYRKNGLGV